MRRTSLISLLLLGALLQAGCSGITKGNSNTSSSPTQTTSGGISVSVLPSGASVRVGGSQTFTATVTGSSNTSVNWQVNGVTEGATATGTITAAGLYTPPSISRLRIPLPLRRKRRQLRRLGKRVSYTAEPSSGGEQRCACIRAKREFQHHCERGKFCQWSAGVACQFAAGYYFCFVHIAERNRRRRLGGHIRNERTESKPRRQ